MREMETKMHQTALELSARNNDLQLANLREKYDSLAARLNMGVGMLVTLQFFLHYMKQP